MGEVTDLWPNITDLQGPYDLILLDPPFAHPTYHKSAVPYETLPPMEFKKLKPILDKIMAMDSALLIWCSGKNIEDVLYLVNYWGYKYKGILLVWFKVKDKPGLGYWTRSDTEFIIFATKGKFSKFRGNARNIA